MLKKLLLMVFVLFSLTTLVSAVSWSVPSTTSSNSNFDIILTGSTLYTIEINVPNGFTLVSDPSNGIVTNGVYRTSYVNNLLVTFRAPQNGTYDFAGQYTEGNGVVTLPTQNINVLISQRPIQCPTCPSDGTWLNCLNGRQTKQTYSCSASTNYICNLSNIDKSCDASSICTAGQTCQGNLLMFQASDCTTSIMENCTLGCNNSTCIIIPDTTVAADTSFDFLYKEVFNIGGFSINVIYLLIGGLVILIYYYKKR